MDEIEWDACSCQHGIHFFEGVRLFSCAGAAYFVVEREDATTATRASDRTCAPTTSV
jgi:hypothetical protein